MNDKQSQVAKPILLQYLAARDSHLAAHEYHEGSYCYENSNGHNYSGQSSRPEEVEDAFQYGHLWLSERGIEGLGEPIPLMYDVKKIRRRIEDRLRKGKEKEILDIAFKINIKLN